MSERGGYLHHATNSAWATENGGQIDWLRLGYFWMIGRLTLSS